MQSVNLLDNDKIFLNFSEPEVTQYDEVNGVLLSPRFTNTELKKELRFIEYLRCHTIHLNTFSLSSFAQASFNNQRSLYLLLNNTTLVF